MCINFVERCCKAEAASALKITGKDLLKLGIIDEVLPEPSGGNNWAPLDAGNTLKEAIEKHLNALLQMPEDELIEERYKKFRVLGKFIEANNIEEIYSEIPKKLNKLKLAFITGATKGIGRSTAITFANAGWDLILLSGIWI